jgi:hypothetical protein
MTLGDESVDYSSVSENYQSVDSKRFNNKLIIENTLSEYAEINGDQNGTFPDNENVPYATIDLNKKKEDRLKKQNANSKPETDQDTIYEDIGDEKSPEQTKESIYEMVSGEYAEVGDIISMSSEYAEPIRND